MPPGVEQWVWVCDFKGFAMQVRARLPACMHAPLTCGVHAWLWHAGRPWLHSSNDSNDSKANAAAAGCVCWVIPCRHKTAPAHRAGRHPQAGRTKPQAPNPEP